MTGDWGGGVGLPPGLPCGGPAALVFRVDDATQVGEVRRAADALAGRVGLTETERGTLAVVVTEAATNLARHAREGRVLVAAVGEPGHLGVEVLTLDEGPGIPNVGRAMEDGFSSAGTSGRGLGAIRRMAGQFDLYSLPGQRPGAGTAVVARVWSAGGGRTAPAGDPLALRIGAVCVSLGWGPVCGDAWTVVPDGERTVVALVDGLGHGPEAALASSEAIRVVRASAGASPGELVRLAHGALRPTRGAAMAVVAVHPARGVATFAGIGNVSAALHALDGTSRSMASHNGTVGHVMAKVQEFSYDWPAGGTLVMHSDGINTRWRLDAYPGLTRHDPTLLAGTLFRDASRGRDDATVLALREPVA